MITNRQWKIDLLSDRSEYARKIQRILYELKQIDEKAVLLPVDHAIAGRTLVKKCWDALPEEHHSYQFNDVNDQTNNARAYLPTTNFTQNVTLHLGWDVLCFTCTLEAAWLAWNHFNTLCTDTYNCCIYPDNLTWYIIRAGNNLYPMIYSEEGYVLNRKQGNL